MSDCTCFIADKKYWTTYGSAVEPASMMEPNPECPEHFPKATHNDWRSAKERREDMAIRGAKFLLSGDLEIAKSYTQAYDAADTELHRIGQELDGGI